MRFYCGHYCINGLRYYFASRPVHCSVLYYIETGADPCNKQRWSTPSWVTTTMMRWRLHRPRWCLTAWAGAAEGRVGLRLLIGNKSLIEKLTCHGNPCMCMYFDQNTRTFLQRHTRTFLQLQMQLCAGIFIKNT